MLRSNNRLNSTQVLIATAMERGVVEKRSDNQFYFGGDLLAPSMTLMAEELESDMSLWAQLEAASELFSIETTSGPTLDTEENATDESLSLDTLWPDKTKDKPDQRFGILAKLLEPDEMIKKEEASPIAVVGKNDGGPGGEIDATTERPIEEKCDSEPITTDTSMESPDTIDGEVLAYLISPEGVEARNFFINSITVNFGEVLDKARLDSGLALAEKALANIQKPNLEDIEKKIKAFEESETITNRAISKIGEDLSSFQSLLNKAPMELVGHFGEKINSLKNTILDQRKVLEALRAKIASYRGEIKNLEFSYREQLLQANTAVEAAREKYENNLKFNSPLQQIEVALETRRTKDLGYLMKKIGNWGLTGLMSKAETMDLGEKMIPLEVAIKDHKKWLRFITPKARDFCKKLAEEKRVDGIVLPTKAKKLLLRGENLIVLNKGHYEIARFQMMSDGNPRLVKGEPGKGWNVSKARDVWSV